MLFAQCSRANTSAHFALLVLASNQSVLTFLCSCSRAGTGCSILSAHAREQRPLLTSAREQYLLNLCSRACSAQMPWKQYIAASSIHCAFTSDFDIYLFKSCLERKLWIYKINMYRKLCCCWADWKLEKVYGIMFLKFSMRASTTLSRLIVIQNQCVSCMLDHNSSSIYRDQ